MKVILTAKVLIDIDMENMKKFEVNDFELSVLDEDGDSILTDAELNDARDYIMGLINKRKAQASFLLACSTQPIMKINLERGC